MTASKVLKRLFLTGDGKGYVDAGDSIVEVELYVTADGTVKARAAGTEQTGIDQQSSNDNLAVRISRGTIDQA